MAQRWLHGKMLDTFGEGVEFRIAGDEGAVESGWWTLYD